ncbi:hypothetical protein QFX18_06885 [Saccharophagus degradans]|uniref:hypothetical protein n=1 Tax=Saccharophagus degradans TaxID=86304 RepID=UPI002477D93E|nr:hypothetical protein [Saccharophagus degradans]WGO99787.1 hypothetical protein QFX18_06885 [Saccharophagus degradans]
MNKRKRNITLSPENNDQLEKLSAMTEFSVSSIIDSAITEFLQREREELVLTGDCIRKVYRFPKNETA